MYNETVIAGVLISMLFTEFTGLSAGVVIPGYLALALHSPRRVVFTIIIAALSTALLKAVSGYLILYGRRRFVFLIVLSFLLGMLVMKSGIVDVSFIGLVIPGIIAREFDRQGYLLTLLSIAATTGITVLIMLLLGMGMFI